MTEGGPILWLRMGPKWQSGLNFALFALHVGERWRDTSSLSHIVGPISLVALTRMDQRCERPCSLKKANNGIPIEPTLSSVSGALTEQLIFEFASLSSWPTKCADFSRNLFSIRTAIPHYLNNYRTIAATNTKAITQELELEFFCHASRRKGNQEASGESIEHHGLHS